MRRVIGGLACVAALAAVPGAAPAAQTPLSRVAEHGCFARLYDRAHLSAHPRQRVGAVWLWAGGAGPADVILAFRIGAATFGGTAVCRADRCTLESDAGSFSLRAVGRDLQISVGDRLSIEGGSGFSPDLSRSADDRVFRLRPADRAVCSAVSF